ncbi:MAG: cation diffusion facilitator family transporter [Alphaproteobacteria bacterium]|nr:cation diffusion facilitator family transporter [Alphaproteobacteria bacterium]
MQSTITAGGDMMKRATYASVAVASLLIAAKLIAWLLTGSVSVLSSLLDSGLDAAASLVNLLAIRTAVTPADREHRFGHGKAEPLAGLGQSAFIAGSAALLFIEALGRIRNPAPLDAAPIGIGVMVFSIVATILLIRYQRRVIKQTGSVAIGADELHYRGDLILNLTVILSLVLSSTFGWHFTDPVFGAGIALWIVYSAWQIARGSLTQLMDREIPDADRARIRAIATAHEEVRAVHDLRTRAAGPTAFIQLHLEMDGGMTLARAHAVSDEVEAGLLEAFPNAEVMIHQDPAGIEEPRQSFPPARKHA